MGQAAFNIAIRFETLTCCYKDCGLTFAAPDSWVDRRRETKAGFYCPNGHIQGFYGDNEADKLRKALVAEQQRTLNARQDAEWQRRSKEAEQRRHSATKGQLTKTKKRISAGVCPCCRRNFVSLGQHMRKQHPDFVQEQPK
jgi:hypothetical protein